MVFEFLGKNKSVTLTPDVPMSLLGQVGTLWKYQAFLPFGGVIPPWASWLVAERWGQAEGDPCTHRGEGLASLFWPVSGGLADELNRV